MECVARAPKLSRVCDSAMTDPYQSGETLPVVERHHAAFSPFNAPTNKGIFSLNRKNPWVAWGQAALS